MNGHDVDTEFGTILGSSVTSPTAWAISEEFIKRLPRTNVFIQPCISMLTISALLPNQWFTCVVEKLNSWLRCQGKSVMKKRDNQ